MLNTLCKTLDPADYGLLSPELAVVDNAIRLTAGVGVLNHPHRRWEYAIALRALSGFADTVIDVGGGGYVLSAALALAGRNVTGAETDPAHGPLFAQAASMVGRPINFLVAAMESLPGTWGAVVSVSVIEHAADDAAFFRAACNAVKPGGLLVLTTDFAESGGAPVCPHHVRTYDGAAMLRLYQTPGFRPIGGTDYSDRGGPVNGYNFCSLVLWKG
jgi:SAM-dependent methyltransferase